MLATQSPLDTGDSHAISTVTIVRFSKVTNIFFILHLYLVVCEPCCWPFFSCSSEHCVFQSKPVKADKPKKKEKTESGDESSSEEESEEEEEEEEEFPSVVPKRNNVLSRPGKRKPRKLNSLDDPSDDDDDDEDFKGSRYIIL